MTAVSQDFTVYSGDAALPIFTVRDSSGAVINISTVSEILWSAQRDLNSTAVISKSKTGGSITFPSGGADGRFQVELSAADTLALSGFYIHEALVTDASGSRSTVATGRLQVGRAPVWTYSGDPGLSDRDAVRYYISDTDASNPLVYDGEIDYLLAQYPTALFAAAQAARNLAGKFTKQVTRKQVGDLSISYSDMAKNYTALAASLQMQAEQTGVQLYAGGTSKADMAAVECDSNRVPQPFARNQFDIPGATGPQTPPDCPTDP